MKKISILVLLISLVVISSCKKSKDDDVDPQTTDLQITVVNELGERISGASVILYRLKTDYLNNINSIDSTTTNRSGQVEFKDLNTINYYFHIEKTPATNEFTEQKTIAPLTKNMLNTVTVLIE